MTIRIGYACINTALPSTNRTIRLANATPERVVALAKQNLSALGEILVWNYWHRIPLFRISSGVIPLGSHPDMTVPWQSELPFELGQVGGILRNYHQRVSMHPGQYTVLSSPHAKVVSASLAELEYHASLLEALGAGVESKIVVHLGGVYGDKRAAMLRFARHVDLLTDQARRRLVLENDERSYTVADALEMAEWTEMPVVFDVFHHWWNPSLPGLSLTELVERCGATWKFQDGRQKLHYSDQWVGKPAGAHSESVNITAFGAFLDEIRGMEVDIMLEVKDKQASVLALYQSFPELIPDLLRTEREKRADEQSQPGPFLQ